MPVLRLSKLVLFLRTCCPLIVATFLFRFRCVPHLVVYLVFKLIYAFVDSCNSALGFTTEVPVVRASVYIIFQLPDSF
jgi:hypothetical protein